MTPAINYYWSRTGNKLFAGVVDTCDYSDFRRFHDNRYDFFVGNNNIGNNLSLVSMTLAIKQLQQYQLAYISKGTLNKKS
jgi:hypothetical protein